MLLPTHGSTTPRIYVLWPVLEPSKSTTANAGEYSYIAIYINRLYCIFRSRDGPAFPDLRSDADQDPLSTYRTASTDSKTASTGLRHALKTAPYQFCPSVGLELFQRSYLYRYLKNWVGTEIKSSWAGHGHHIRLAARSDSLLPSYGWEFGSDLSSGSFPAV